MQNADCLRRISNIAEKLAIDRYIDSILHANNSFGFWNRTMKNSLINVRRTLHELLKALPAIKAQGSEETMKKHMALIKFYQRQYDQLVATSALPA